MVCGLYFYKAVIGKGIMFIACYSDVSALFLVFFTCSKMLFMLSSSGFSVLKHVGDVRRCENDEWQSVTYLCVLFAFKHLRCSA